MENKVRASGVGMIFSKGEGFSEDVANEWEGLLLECRRANGIAPSAGWTRTMNIVGKKLVMEVRRLRAELEARSGK